MTRRDDAWAIVTGDGGFIGVRRMDHAATVRPWNTGTMLALFHSRALARAHLPRVKGPAKLGLYPRARVVRVAVTVTVTA